MKIKRLKKVHKNLNFYVNNFGFHQPFQILIDGTFCFAALKNKINIQEQLPKYLQADVKLLTTQCVVLETELLGSKVTGAMKIVKQFAVHKCGHEKKPTTGSECFKIMAKQNHTNRYIIASQDRGLQEYLRKIPGTPILYLHQIAPILEQPSDVSITAAKCKTNSHLSVSQVDDTVIKKLKESSGVQETIVKPKRKRNKAGPNPLSCLKKKSMRNHIGNKSADRSKRKRLKLSEHLKNEIIKTKN